MYQIDSFDPRTEKSTVDGHYVDRSAARVRFAALCKERPAECHYARSLIGSKVAIATFMPAASDIYPSRQRPRVR